MGKKRGRTAGAPEVAAGVSKGEIGSLGGHTYYPVGNNDGFGPTFVREKDVRAR